MGERIRLELDMDAETLNDLGDKLMGLATDIARGQFSDKAVFASPSCKGHYWTSRVPQNGRSTEP